MNTKELLSVVSTLNYPEYFWPGAEGNNITFLTMIDAEITLEVADSIGLTGKDYQAWRDTANL